MNHTNLKAGTFLVHVLTETKVRLDEDMRDCWASVHYVRKDGQRDNRKTGWSGTLKVDDWRVVDPPGGERFQKCEALRRFVAAESPGARKKRKIGGAVWFLSDAAEAHAIELGLLANQGWTDATGV